MSAVMTELSWKAFIAAIITAVVLKVFGSKWGFFLLFSVSFIGWYVGLFLLFIISDIIYESWKKRKRK